MIFGTGLPQNNKYRLEKNIGKKDKHGKQGKRHQQQEPVYNHLSNQNPITASVSCCYFYYLK